MRRKAFKIIAIVVSIALLFSFVIPSFSYAEEESVDKSNSIIRMIKEQVAMWYYVIRLICIAVMLCLLIFIGIKMALKSTGPADRAFYTKMLSDWVAGFMLVFGIHYIMIGILSFNDLTVDMIQDVASELYKAAPSEYGDTYVMVDGERVYDASLFDGNGNYIGESEEDIETSLFENLRTRAYELKLSVGLPGMILYACFVYYAWKYTFIYLRRVINIIVLTLLGPPIAVSYAFNKTLTGRSKLFSAWLREYIMNTFIQSIHALCYVTFTLPVLKFSLQSVAGMLMSIVLLRFMADADSIIRKVFNVGGGGSGVIDSIAGRNVGKEAFDAYKGAVTAVAGQKAIRSLAKIERKALTAPARIVGKKTFGGIQTLRARKQDNKEKKEEQSVEDKKFQFAKKNFNVKKSDVEIEEDEQGIKRYKFKNLSQKQLEELGKFEAGKREELTNKRSKRADREAKKGEAQLNKMRVLNPLSKNFGKSYNDIISEIKTKRAQYYHDAHDPQRDDETDEDYARRVKEGSRLLGEQELELQKWTYKRNTHFRAQLLAAGQGISDILDPKKYTEKRTVTNPFTGKEREKIVAKRSERKRTGFLTYSQETDGLSTRIKENMNIKTVLGLTQEDEQALKDAADDVKNIFTALIGGIVGMATISDPGLSTVAGGILIGKSLQSSAKLTERQAKRVQKMQAQFNFVGAEVAEQAQGVFSQKELMHLANYANMQLGKARDQYIAYDVTNKHNWVVNKMMRGHMRAVNGLVAMGSGGRHMGLYYRGGTDGQHSVSLIKCARWQQINKIYRAQNAIDRVMIAQAQRTLRNNGLYATDKNGKIIVVNREELGENGTKVDENGKLLFYVDDDGNVKDGNGKYVVTREADGKLHAAHVKVKKANNDEAVRTNNVDGQVGQTNNADSQVRQTNNVDSQAVRTNNVDGQVGQTNNADSQLSGSEELEDVVISGGFEIDLQIKHGKTIDEIRSMSREQLVEEYAVDKKLAYSNGYETVVLTPDAITDEVFKDQGDSAKGKKKDKEDIFEIMAAASLVAKQEQDEREAASQEEIVDQRIIEEEETIVVEGEKAVRFSKGDVKDAISQAAIQMQISSISDLATADKSCRDKIIDQLIDNLIKDGVLSKDAIDSLDLKNELGACVDDVVAEMAVTEQVNAAVVEIMDEVADEARTQQEELRQAGSTEEVKPLEFNSEEFQSRLQTRVTEKVHRLAQAQSLAYSGNEKLANASQSALDAANTLSGLRSDMVGDGSGQATLQDAMFTAQANEARSSMNPQTSDGNQSIESRSQGGSRNVGSQAVDGSRRVGARMSNMDEIPLESYPGQPVRDVTFSDEPEARTLEEQTRRDTEQKLQGTAQAILANTRKVNSSQSSKFKVKEEVTFDEAAQQVQAVEQAKREDLSDKLAQLLQADINERASVVYDREAGVEITAEPTVAQLLDRIGVADGKSMTASGTESRSRELSESERQLQEQLAASFLGFQQLEEEMLLTKDFTEFKAEKEPQLVTVGSPKQAEKKYMYMGLVADGEHTFHEVDTDLLGDYLGVDRKLKNLTNIVNNAASPTYTQEQFESGAKIARKNTPNSSSSDSTQGPDGSASLGDVFGGTGSRSDVQRQMADRAKNIDGSSGRRGGDIPLDEYRRRRK